MLKSDVYVSNKKRILFTHDVLSHFLGRVSRQAAKIAHSSQASAQSKLNRRNHAKQIQLQKRQSLLSAVRIFGGVDGAPRVVAVVPLCEGVTSRDVVSELSRSLELPTQTDQECIWKIKFVGPLFHFCVSSLSLCRFPEGWNDLSHLCNSFS
jgi:hypothetical protein